MHWGTPSATRSRSPQHDAEDAGFDVTTLALYGWANYYNTAAGRT